MTAAESTQPAKTQVGTAMRAPKTAELIASHLRRQIVRGELTAGETLPPEVGLMEQFSVSRPTLREAFRILEAESLIRVRRGARGGAQVLAPDPMVAARHVGLLLQLQGTTLEDVYNAREVTEPVCARMLAEIRTEQDLADLNVVVDGLAALIEAGPETVTDISRWSEAAYRFHELLMQRCGNTTLAVQGAVLADIAQTHLTRSISQGMRRDRFVEPNLKRLLQSFRKMVRLIEARDADAAEQQWRAHMAAAKKSAFLFDPKDMPLVDLFE
ncbi:FadR/GntR family transcriptional regulator [Gordonia liuliyuniae]|uniref:FCD domain-containing protein n=1 Tax=Gordonia liuliyuniae TaxID=2911517 RepID=A0ABS9IP13_9ACTN|nr:GntR family transcriptional regulator [Gordonia liuliyuniae]MCF8587289.1 FCD domain-containing protein [Gordonia liuliyuniae]